MSNLKNYLFTSESVSEGHPDKVSDRISDMVVDTYLSGDPFSRVACETLTTTNKVVLAGEVRGPEIKKEELVEKVRNCIKDIGYDQDGFSWREATKIESHLHSQSADIAMGVDSSGNKDEGAGDQGIMFGYACSETLSLMPAPIFYAHKILEELSSYRKSNESFFLPDSKSQVSMSYENGIPKKVESLVVSTQHNEAASNIEIRKKVIEIIEKAIPSNILPHKDNILINPTGRFVIGGPDGDSGLTGRKIIVDTYGGAAPHGGGAFSGKDPSKVDRSAAYAGRYVAKNIVGAGLAKKAIVQISYAIGVAEPTSINVSTMGTGSVSDVIIEKAIKNTFDLRPRGIVEMLNLLRPIYEKTASYGHFGREEPEFSWEKKDKIEELKNACNT